MNSDAPVVYKGAPLASVATLSVTTTAALPLSYIAAIRPTTVAVPDTGNGWCRVTDCEPCTSMAGLKVPMLENVLPAPGMTTGNVGSAC